MKNNLLEQFPEWICTTPEGGIKILSQILYKNLKNDLKLKISDKGNYFLYRNGLYALVSERELKSIIKSHIPVELRKPKDWNTVWLEFCSDEPNVIESNFNSNENLVPFENGVLKLDSGKLIEYDENMLLTRRINCKYYAGKTLEDNSLLTFVKDCFIYYPDCHYIKRADFNKYYKVWCAANRVYPERDREIGKQLKTHFGIDARKTHGYYYYPIEIKEEVLNEFEIDK